MKRNVGPYQVMYSPISAAILQTQTNPTPVPSSVSEDYKKTADHILWGTSDNFPIELKTDVEKDTVLAPGLTLKSEMQYGAGVSMGKILSDGGKEVFEAVRDQDIVDFFRANFMDDQVYKSLYDMNYFGSCFPQFIMSRDRKSIAGYTLRNTRAIWTRLGRRNPKTGFSEHVVINADFGTGSYKKENDKMIPVAPEFGAYDWVLEQAQKESFTDFVLPMQITDSGRQYYPVPDWNSARKSKWVEISQIIAEFKKYMIENQLTIKYHIKVHPDYWPLQFGDDQWAKWSADEKITAQQEWVDSFGEFLSGKEGAAGTLMTPKGMKRGVNGDTFDYIEVTEMKGLFSKDGTYIEDSLEASQHKISALGLHGEITGSSPSSQLGAGSGSGSRVAFNQRVSMSKHLQDVVLHPLYLISKVNGWNQEISFRMRNSLITTLDTGASATAPSPQT